MIRRLGRVNDVPCNHGALGNIQVFNILLSRNAISHLLHNDGPFIMTGVAVVLKQ